MPVEYDGGVARLVGDCRVDEAGDLAEWLCATPGARVDMGRAGHLHAAVMQSLLALRPALIARPGDSLLAGWLAGLPAVPSGSTPISEDAA